MPRPSSLLASLTAVESHDFLPHGMHAQIAALSDQFTEIDPSTLETEAWHELLHQINPEVLVCCWRTRALPDPLPSNLRYVCYLAGSIKKLATRKQIEDGLLITNWGDSISRTIAECALLHTLCGLRGAAKWAIDMHAFGAWKNDKTRTRSLFDRKVGIRGFGRIARELITLLKPFNCEISVLAPDVDESIAEKHGLRYSPDLNDLFSYNDVVIELAPLIEVTRRSIQESHLRLLRPQGVFINVGRGATVDEDALLRVAREGQINVGLDVYSEEPLPADSGFRELPNVMLTPHIAGPTTDKRPDAGAYGVKNLIAYAQDQSLVGIITPEVYDQST